MANILKFAKTGALIFSWICMGLFSEVSSPTLPYLKDRVRCNYEQISRALVARAIGFFTGSVIAGVLGSKWRCLNNFWMFLALCLAGTATVAAPWCPNLALLAAMFLVDGTGKGMICVVASTGIMDLWQENAAVPTHALHFSFGIGALVAPLISCPFIPKRTHSTNGVIGNKTFTYGRGANSFVLELHLNSTNPGSGVYMTDNIEIAYAITGGVTILCGIVFLYFQITARKSDRRMIVKKRTEGGHGPCNQLAAMFKGIKRPVVILMLIIFVFWCLPTGAERAYGKFLFAYAVDGPLGMAPATGTALESVFWASFTAGRGLATVVSKWMPPHVLLAAEITLKIICAIVLTFCANSNQTILFLVSGLFGATISPVFPAAIVWTNLYVEMDAMMNSFAFLSGAFGAMVFSWVAGYLFTYVGPSSLMYLMTGYAVGTLVVYIIMFTYLRFGVLKRRDNPDNALANSEMSHLNANGTVSDKR